MRGGVTVSSSVQRKDHQERYYPHMLRFISIHIIHIQFITNTRFLEDYLYFTLICVKKQCKSEVANSLCITVYSMSLFCHQLVVLWTFWVGSYEPWGWSVAWNSCNWCHWDSLPYNKPELMLMYLLRYG